MDPRRPTNEMRVTMSLLKPCRPTANGVRGLEKIWDWSTIICKYGGNLSSVSLKPSSLQGGESQWGWVLNNQVHLKQQESQRKKK
jgi:hypothetical protein